METQPGAVSPAKMHLAVWTWAGSQVYGIDAWVDYERWDEEVDQVTKTVYSFKPLSP